MLNTDTAISVNSLEKSYKNLNVLRRISFEIKKGSIFALLGSNGAGKTTTIKILSTLLKPDGGSAQICSYDVVSQPDRVRGEISLTGQSAAVDDVLTGRENLRMIGKLRHLPDANRKADELLERFQLLDAADRRVATYSGGMRRRLDLAMSLIGKPSVMSGRMMRHTFRSIDTLITVVAMPIMMMLMFVYIFGGSIDTGSIKYINYVVPGIVLMCIVSGVAYTAFRLNNDVTKGIIERFRSMPIARSSVLGGHVLTSVVFNAFSTILILIFAALIGFRTDAGITGWLLVTGILLLFTLAMTWIAVMFGLLANSAEGAGVFSYILLFLLYYKLRFCANRFHAPNRPRIC